VHWRPIHKSRTIDGTAPNLADYEAVRWSFSWDRARAELDGLPGGGLNIAYEAVDRHLVHGRGDRQAIIGLGKNDAVRNLRYADLAAASSRFAKESPRGGDD
jgi:acetyl-CoA synthetase